MDETAFPILLVDLLRRSGLDVTRFWPIKTPKSMSIVGFPPKDRLHQIEPNRIRVNGFSAAEAEFRRLASFLNQIFLSSQRRAGSTIAALA